MKVLLENKNPESALLESLESGRRWVYPGLVYSGHILNACHISNAGHILNPAEAERSPSYPTVESDIALLHVYFGQTTTTSG